MKKKIIAMELGFVAFALISTGIAQASPFQHRKANQRHKIHQGVVVSGSLDYWETQALKHEQKHINNFHNHALNDGVFMGWERNHLKHMQNSASKHIYKLKHNPW